MSLIALEEHFAWDPASADNVVATWLRSNNYTQTGAESWRPTRWTTPPPEGRL